MATDDGGAAYPMSPNSIHGPRPGMTLLDHFAGLALHKLMGMNADDAAREAYLYATAAVKEKRRLEKEATP